MAKTKAKEKSSTSGSLLELVMIVVVALGLALGIQAFLVKPYRIPTPSMVPTLTEEQRVLVNRIGNNFTDPSVGDIIVFTPPAGADETNGGPPCGQEPPPGAACSKPTSRKSDTTYIKRVVAGPGDRLAIRDGKVYRNGKRAKEPFAQPCGDGGTCDLPEEITIPADHYFMMGDNRGDSFDSRAWGPVPREWIIGKAFATYWPPKRIGLF